MRSTKKQITKKSMRLRTTDFNDRNQNIRSIPGHNGLVPREGRRYKYGGKKRLLRKRSRIFHIAPPRAPRKGIRYVKGFRVMYGRNVLSAQMFGGASISSNSAPSRKRRVVNGQMTTPPPPPVAPSRKRCVVTGQTTRTRQATNVYNVYNRIT